MMRWDDVKKRLHDFIYGDYKNQIKELEFLNNTLSTTLKSFEDRINSYAIAILDLTKQLEETKELVDTGWYNPFSFKNYTRGDFKTIITDSMKTLNIPPNTFITPNDSKIKAEVSKYSLRKDSLESTANAVKTHLKNRISYVYDHQNSFSPDKIENFQSASMTWQLKKGDCEDMAILFQTFMHVCGYGKECFVVVDKKGLTKWFNGNYIGHAWNKVFLNFDWYDFDVNAAIFNRETEVSYPVMERTSYFFNFWGVFKW